MLTLRRLPIVLILLLCVAAWGQDHSVGEVKVGSRLVLTLPAPVGAISAAERAEILNRRLDAVLKSPQADANQLQLEVDADGAPLLVLGPLKLLSVTQPDADAYGTTREELADRWLRQIKNSLNQLKPLYRATQKESISVKFLSEHRVFLLLLQVGVLLLLAHGCGELVRALSFPPVLGHLSAGILLGPSFLGWMAPQAMTVLFPQSQTQSYLLEVVSWLGVILLLALTGLETDLELIRRQGRPAFWASLLGIAFPFVSGLALGLTVPDSVLTNPESRLIFALFLATAMSISSVPVVAKILLDMGLIRRSIGQTILAAAIIDDTIGWMILAVIAGMITTGNVEPLILLKAATGTALYVWLLFFVLKRPIFACLRWIRNRLATEEVMIAVLIAIIVFSAAVTQYLGVHAVLGAFLAGVFLRQWPYATHLLAERVEGITLALFAPIFFAAAGIHVRLDVLASAELLKLTLVSTGVACFGKVVGCYFGGRLGRLGVWEALSLGIGMNARGAMGLIIAVLGFSLGILTVNMFSVIVLVALATTVMTPPLLRWSLGHVQIDPSELERLQQASDKPSFLSSIRRVLLASRGGPGALAASRLVAWLNARQSLEVTVACVGPAPEEMQTLREGLQDVDRCDLEVLPAGPPAASIVRRAGHDFDLIAIGAHQQSAGSGVFGAVADEVILSARCPVLVMAGAGHLAKPQSILLALTGTGPAEKASQLALSLAKSTGARLDAVHILERPNESLFWSLDRLDHAREAGQEILDQVTSQGRAMSVPVVAYLLEGGSAGVSIAQHARDRESSLIVVGAERRSSSRLFLGPTLTYLLRHSGCPLAVLVV